MTTPTIYRTTSTDPDISYPKGIAINSDDNKAVICDIGNDVLCECHLYGLNQIQTVSRYVTHTVDTGNEVYDQVDMSNPTGICYWNGYYFFTDTGNHVVVQLDKNLNYVNHFGTVGTSGSSTSLLNGPQGLCHDGYYLYVCDITNARIVKLKLEDLSYVAQDNNINGTFTPAGIAYQNWGDRNLYITDSTNTRVIKCKTDFTYITQNSANISAPLGILVDNFVYVCDSIDDDIIVLETEDLTQVTTLSDSTITLTTPYGLAMWEDALFITDYGADRITVWRKYIPADDAASDDDATFGLTDLTFGDDEPILDDEEEYGTQNRWVEETKHKGRAIDWVEE